jgi:chromatin assembly factor 1 subunit B
VIIYKYTENLSKKAPQPITKHSKLSSKKMYQDEDLNSFFRRLEFSPDGSILITTAGVGSAGLYTAFIYSRDSIERYNSILKERSPIAQLPNHKKPVIAVRFSPVKYSLRQSKSKPLLSKDFRYIFAVATQDSVVVYDTQHAKAIAIFGNLHYATVTDISWSKDGLKLMMSSTDGFCSLIEFSPGELGDIVYDY